MTIKKYGTGIGAGWHKESERHALASRGIKTAKGDMPVDYAKSALEKKHNFAEGWEKRIKAEQDYPYIMDLVTKKKFKRIKFGDSDYDNDANRCGDCGVAVGQYHVDGCDMERSPLPNEEGGQMLSSDRAGKFYSS